MLSRYRIRLSAAAAAVLGVTLAVPAGLATHGVAARADATAVCPALGSDTDCGLIITISSTGTQLDATGQGPYDDDDDTLIGVVNNSTSPIRSLGLSSGADIFNFDGDGIDTFGAPGNTQDDTGYGGPDAFFSGISGGELTGLVNFVTPIPPGGTTYFSLEDSIASAVSCQDVINGAVRTTADGPDIDAEFTPNLGLSLAAAAQVCGFENFDWVQAVTRQDDPSMFFARNLDGGFDANVSGPVRLGSSATPYSDPPAGGGYTYESEPDFSFPFYYEVSTELPEHETGDQILTFQDAPGDGCLPGGDRAGTPTCDNTSEPPGSHGSFVTRLAGVNADGSATDLGIGFDWTSDYNGTTGGVSVRGTEASADGNGTGGVTVTGVHPDTTYQYDGLSVTSLNGGPAGPAPSMLAYSGPQALPDGAPATLSAQLTGLDSKPVAGRRVTLALGGGRRPQACTAVSSASGAVSCRVLVAQRLGPATVTASFAGDTSFLASTTSDSVIVFAYTPGGTFVAGDKSAGNLLAGAGVTFWSPRWARVNQLSGGPAPGAFHGLALTIAPPRCSALTTWHALPESGRPVPPRPVPAYTAVIVASSITARGPFIRGDMTHIVIVAAGHGPGQAPSGAGTIVATLC